MDTQVIRIHRHGDPDVLQLETVTLGSPGAGEVLIRQTAIGVNFIDTYHRSGLYPLPMPSGLGQEACGVVEAVGDGVKEFRPGDRVAYAGGTPGAYAQHRIVPAAKLVPVPEAISDDIAAGTLLRGMTAQYLLKRTFPVKAGMTVLIHAAAGGVGQIACQWARALGATVIGTAGGAEKCALASRWCDHVIDYRVDDFAARVSEITGGAGVPVVYDGVGAVTFDGSLDSLSPRGMLVSFGNASGAVPPFSPNLLAQKGSLFLTRPTLGHYTATRDELLDTAEDYFTAVARGHVVADIGQRFALADVALAHRELEARRTTGSTLLAP
ncbi:quinone oxidoreductase family protein [Jeongeupia naejangsanensis]|uniref:Quinone oxidoreductase n=1 Tax=Jeongeupia naejangsanensis TaxID=613195 RepID=A0ABS2BPZ7_9NEIS|nr:quinone oxidoreductase [Jeongeupia naejangsanensis]MBM3117643.1 quinone oxidoreductase [Jeongeupia naejangsanensis]